MARYKCIDDSFSKTFSVWVFVTTYGKRNVGTPPIPSEPKISGLLREDALFWAWGQARMMIDGGSWRMAERGPDEVGTGEVTILEDKEGAKYSIHVADEDPETPL